MLEQLELLKELKLSVDIADIVSKQLRIILDKMKPSEFIKQDENCFESNGMILFKESEINDLLIDLDEKFIDKEKLIDIDAGTCLGLEVHRIQKMIDFFKKEGFNPYGEHSFATALSVLKLS